MAKNSFTYEYEQDRHNSISYEYSSEEDEKMDMFMAEGTPFVHLNRSGMLMLARILIKMAQGDYDDSFHVHLRKDFNPDLPERLILGISPETNSQSKGSL